LFQALVDAARRAQAIGTHHDRAGASVKRAVPPDDSLRVRGVGGVCEPRDPALKVDQGEIRVDTFEPLRGGQVELSGLLSRGPEVVVVEQGDPFARRRLDPAVSGGATPPEASSRITRTRWSICTALFTASAFREPSSTTITSSSVNRCSSAERTAWAHSSGRSRVGTIADTAAVDTVWTVVWPQARAVAEHTRSSGISSASARTPFDAD
jgi:hypothetical protein